MAILLAWRFCPRCASELDLEHAPARVECRACGFVGHANSAPCVGAVVEDADGRILLARRAVEPYLGLWDTPGGYLEEGEHPLDGFRRELLEETGLDVEPQRSLGAFMDWYGEAPDAQSSLNLSWTARASSADAEAAGDVSELRWFAPDALPPDDELAFHLLPAAFAAWKGLR